MEIEIWSDVVCPFCYLGKRRFEKALRDFPGRDAVNVTWKSFQLHPGLRARPGASLESYLEEHKGWSLPQIRANHDRLARAGAELGLDYRFEKAVIADTFDAHRLLQMAKAEEKKKGSGPDGLAVGKTAAGPDGLAVGTSVPGLAAVTGDALKERLFRAYFTEGGNIGDADVLIELAEAVGLPREKAAAMLADKTAYADAVREDLAEAERLGIGGVPFFVFDRRFAVSGAQDAEVFRRALAEAAAS